MPLTQFNVKIRSIRSRSSLERVAGTGLYVPLTIYRNTEYQGLSVGQQLVGRMRRSKLARCPTCRRAHVLSPLCVCMRAHVSCVCVSVCHALHGYGFAAFVCSLVVCMSVPTLTFWMRALMFGASNAWRPAVISYSTHPNDQMSLFWL